jgi:transposase
MNISPGFVGIDVSKSSLDVFDAAIGRSERIENASAPIAALIERWRGKDVFVLFEATGRYDRTLRTALAAAGIRFARVNPLRARDFARAAGFLAKTDAVDAKMLAAMAERLRPNASPPGDVERERLRQLHGRRDQLVFMRKRHPRPHHSGRGAQTGMGSAALGSRHWPCCSYHPAGADA